MKRIEAAERRVEEYLREVERHLAHKPEAVRKEVVAGLRDHVGEALKRAEERGELGMEVVERILSEMDAPETFAEAAAEAAVGAAAAVAPEIVRSGGAHWFALALAFFFLNAYGVWRWTAQRPPPEAPPSAASAETESPARAEERILRLRSVEQVDVSPERELMLRLAFSDRPDRDQLTRFLRLRAAEQGEVEYQLSGASSGNELIVRTAPVLADKLEYELDAGMPSLAESKPMDKAARGTLAMEMNMMLRGIETESPSFESALLKADFNAFPDANGAKDYVTVEPATSFAVEAVEEWDWQGLRLRGEFQPGGIYDVTFKEGLPAANGSSLPKTIRRTVHFPPREKAVRIDSPGRYLAPGGTLAVPVSAANLEKYAARLSPVFANNLVQLALRESEWTRYWGGTTEDLTGKTRMATNALPRTADGSPARGAVDLRSLAGGEPRGVYWLEVDGEDARSDGRLLVVTDLGLAARAYKGGVLAWVNSLRTAEPAAGATVTAYARNNQVLARGTTDERGVARMEIGEGEEPFLVVAESGGDLSYVDLDRTRVEAGEGLEGMAYLERGQIEAAVFTERGIYRPGETVFAQALARDDQMQAPGAFPALLRVRRPDGRVFRDVPVELDEYGSARGEVKLPEYLPTGRYGFELAMPGTFTVLGQTEVALEDFVPPQIRVAVEAPQGRANGGDVLDFGVRGDHLFGRAASGLKARADATFAPTPFAPAHWPGWQFGDEQKAFASIHRQIGSATLDGDGGARFQVDTRKAWRPPAALKVVVQATVMESSGRAVSAFGSAQVDPYPFYVGMKPSWDGAVRAGETQRVAVAQVMPSGDAAESGKPLVVALSRVTWNSVLRRNSRGRYEWKSERQSVEIRQDTLAAGEGQAEWAFSVDSPGDYELAASDPASGASTRLSFFAGSSDPAWAAWSREKPGRVELAWDRERYRPGDVARLQVRAPFAGRALLTLETDRVKDVRVVELAKNTAEFEVAVEEGFCPNAYCTVTLIRPARAEAVWSAHRAMGSIVLPVERPNRGLTVEIEAPERSRPQSALAGTVTVRQEDGAPAKGHATVMAVDEGICRLTDFATPDPLRIFAAQRALGVSAHDLYGELMPIEEEQMEGTSAPGGDGEEELRKRLNPIKANRFKPVALWLAALPLDVKGRADFRFDVPEFSGELRLMAVAYNETQTGSTSTPVQVKRDLVAQPALPRFMAMGDTCDATVALHNESGQAVTATLRATSGGPVRIGVAEQRIELAAGGSAQATVPLSAGPGYGKALVTFEVEAGEETYRETIEMAVRPAAGSRVATDVRVLSAGESATIVPPADWLRESLSVSGTLSTLPSVQMGRALDYVVHYPYGCLEQTVSGAFPLLYAGDWAERLLPGSRAIGDVDAFVPQAISRVLSMQQSSGGFALWPFSRGVAEEESIYAIHFLVEAKAADFAVPESALDAALGWARRRLDRAIPGDVPPEEWQREMQARAYLCHVLALAGRPDAGWAARLREQSDRLGFGARAQTAAALLAAGEPRQAVAMMESLAIPAARSRMPGMLFDSDVRDAAILLSAWLDIDPENSAVAKLAQALKNRQRDGHWGNTQDNALALLAFGKLARQLPDAEQPVAGTATLPDGTARAFSGTNDVAWSLAPGAGGPVTIRNEGPGKLYLCVRHEGVSSVPEETSTNGVSIEREFLDLDGNARDASEAAQGDLIVVRLTLDSQGNRLDQLAIEDQLPAGWEIENPNVAASQQIPWLRRREEGDRYRDARDDRMLIFTGPVNGKATFHYAARAVTPGEYALPPTVVSGMYEPETRGVAAGGRVRVVP